MDRRNFSKLVASAGVLCVSIQVVGCGESPEAAAQGSTLKADGTGSIQVWDLTMEGWSNLGSGFLGNTGTLKAKQIAAGVQITLNYVQDPHGHTFTLTAGHFKQLLRGEAVDVITTEAEGHDHRVHIDPKNHAPGSTPLTIPLDSGVVEKLWANLPEGERQSLYVASSAELVDDSVEYCMDAQAACDANPSLWKRMARHALRQDKQIYKTDALSLSGSEQLVSVRGTNKKDSKLLKFVLKLTKI